MQIQYYFTFFDIIFYYFSYFHNKKCKIFLIFRDLIPFFAGNK